MIFDTFEMSEIRIYQWKWKNLPDKVKMFPELLSMSKEEKLWPEPAPNWPEAKKVWKWGWPFHVYLFTTLNFLVVLRSLYVMIEQKKSHVLTKDHRFFMNLFLLVFGTTRAVFLLSNPYGSDPDATKTELVICIVTFGIGTACITACINGNGRIFRIE